MTDSFEPCRDAGLGGGVRVDGLAGRVDGDGARVARRSLQCARHGDRLHRRSRRGRRRRIQRCRGHVRIVGGGCRGSPVRRIRRIRRYLPARRSRASDHVPATEHAALRRGLTPLRPQTTRTGQRQTSIANCRRAARAPERDARKARGAALPDADLHPLPEPEDDESGTEHGPRRSSRCPARRRSIAHCCHLYASHRCTCLPAVSCCDACDPACARRASTLRTSSPRALHFTVYPCRVPSPAASGSRPSPTLLIATPRISLPHARCFSLLTLTSHRYAASASPCCAVLLLTAATARSPSLPISNSYAISPTSTSSTVHPS